MKNPYFAPLAVLLLSSCSGGEDAETNAGPATDNPLEGSGGGTDISSASGGDSALGGANSASTGGTGETASGGNSSDGSGGTSAVPIPKSTVVEGISFEALPCGSELLGETVVSLGPTTSTHGGWSHFHNGTFDRNGLDASGLLSEDLSVYDVSNAARAPETECDDAPTWHQTLARRVEGHTNKHPNGLQVRGSHPDLSTVASLVIDLKLEAEGTNIPAGIPDIHDGSAVLQVAANDDPVRIPINAELYLDHWIRITLPASKLGTGTPARLQFVAELSTGGIDASRNDFEELDLNIYQIAYVLN